MELITIKQAAQVLNVSVSTVRNMLQRGELPALRVGKQIRFVREDLERWIRQRVSRERGLAPVSFVRRLAMTKRAPKVDPCASPSR